MLCIHCFIGFLRHASSPILRSQLHLTEKVLLLDKPDVERFQLLLIHKFEVKPGDQFWNDLGYLHQADILSNTGPGT